eukprot:scaffold220619_cov35-Prasinocladus_malaysianus.AAC.1
MTATCDCCRLCGRRLRVHNHGGAAPPGRCRLRAQGGGGAGGPWGLPVHSDPERPAGINWEMLADDITCTFIVDATSA